MLTTLFIFSVFVGFIIARQQFRGIRRNGVIQWGILRLLMTTILFALLTGVMLHQIGRIDSIGLYLYIISTGVSLGLFMTFERLLKKFWYSVLIVTLLAGLICYLFMNAKTGQIIQGSYLIGTAPGIGYLIFGLIVKQWNSISGEDEQS